MLALRLVRRSFPAEAEAFGEARVPGVVGKEAPTAEGRPSTLGEQIALWVGKEAPTAAFFAEASQAKEGR